ncbi:MAG: alanine--tRNA ligase [Nitrospinae bacterium]|nr:alanine--tRNA ligase [Nitrospinota bacterium]
MNKPMKTSEDIRKSFISFFESKGHKKYPSSSLIPENDKSILFTNAGMVQFKRVFQGEISNKDKRAISIQKCMRAGGKHNDLENVGFTARHHTFFEMLGNFSFGDYFKKEAIQFAWEYLTQVISLDKNKLYVSVYKDDHDAYEIWNKDIGIEKERIFLMGEKDNFWSMGDTGPCGPCSEIFIDRGKEHGCENSSCSVGCDCDRFLEIWNLVFMEFDRQPNGEMLKLPKQSIDTGMGLERLLSILNNADSNYDTDLFLPIINFISSLSGISYKPGTEASPCFRVIADHSRATLFLLYENVIPSNEGSGYVLRRIIRRALRYGGKLGFEEPFFYKVIEKAAEVSSAFYPEIKSSIKNSMQLVKEEEIKFQDTLNRGLPYLYKKIENHSDAPIKGHDIFVLSDTYGIPTDLTDEILREHEITYDIEEYNQAMENQKKMSREATKGGKIPTGIISDTSLINQSEFLGYTHDKAKAKITAIIDDKGNQHTVSGKGTFYITLDNTVLYGESGGQVGDTGIIKYSNKTINVLNTQKESGIFLHLVELEGNEEIQVNDTCEVAYDGERRSSIARNHSATHLLHASLRNILGDHVKQAGSLVEEKRVRFDFTHHTALSEREILDIEKQVNREILANKQIKTDILSLDEAISSGATALFDEKYQDKVRVVTMGDFSKELCGGTHVTQTGDIGLVKILAETSVSAGVRRIEATSGLNIIELLQDSEKTLEALRDLLKATKGNESEKVSQLLDETKKQKKEIEKLKEQLASGSSQNNEIIKKVNDIDVIIKRSEFKDTGLLRKNIDTIKENYPKSISLVYYGDEERIVLLCGVTDNLTSQYQAGKLIKAASSYISGNGGGRADFAQGGGTDITKLDELIANFPEKFL